MDRHDDEYLAAQRRVEARIGFLVHLGVFAVINLIFLIVVGWNFLWATVPWGFGLALHGFAVFVRDTGKFDAWKHRAVERELARRRGQPPPSGSASAAEASVPSENATPGRSAPAAQATVPAEDATHNLGSDEPTISTTGVQDARGEERAEPPAARPRRPAR
jgi:hypothetical protein